MKEIDWLTAPRSSSIKKSINTGAIQLSLFDEKYLVEIRTEDYPEERLVICRNPSLAEERARKRQALLAAAEKELQKIDMEAALDGLYVIRNSLDSKEMSSKE